MKRTLLALATVVLLGASSLARAGDLEDKRDALLKAEWLKKADWITDYDKALAESKKTGKSIFVYFTRSDTPSPPCAALERGALSDPKFPEFAKNYVLFCHITTKIPGEQYGDLLEKKGGNAFPYLVFMSSDGDVLVQHQGPRTVDAFEETGIKAQKLVELRKKADAGDTSAKIDLLIADLEAGRLKADEVDKKLAPLGTLSADQKRALESARANGEVRAIYEPYQSALQDKTKAKQAHLAIGKKLLERKNAKKPVPTGEQEWQNYWGGILTYAQIQKDAGLYEEAYDQIKAKYGSLPQAKATLDKMAKTLEALKKGSAPKGDDGSK